MTAKERKAGPGHTCGGMMVGEPRWPPDWQPMEANLFIPAVGQVKRGQSQSHGLWASTGQLSQMWGRGLGAGTAASCCG